MEELDQLWREISEKTGRDRFSTPKATDGFSPSSLNLLKIIRQRTRWKLYFIYLFIAAYLGALIWVAENWESRLVFAAMTGFALVNLWLVQRPYARMKKQDLLMSGSSREVIQHYYDCLDTMLRQENFIGALFTPPAAMLGFLFAIIEEKGSAAVVFSDWRLLLLMLVVATLLVPFGAWLTRSMNKVAFGKYLDHLKENLDQLDAS